MLRRCLCDFDREGETERALILSNLQDQWSKLDHTLDFKAVKSYAGTYHSTITKEFSLTKLTFNMTFLLLDDCPPLSFHQIFPDPVEVVLSPDTNRLDHDRERLPSIVVEPTELSEVESGELRWPPENIDMEEDEEDLFLEQCIPPANIADWGEEEEEEEEETSVVLTQQPGLTLIGKLDT